ncbi:hypothetical protein AGMMS49942_23440 [Spirochaetia bacterium]|nr:hypothetical protein AGMMS49942_23440 [Spirochaetia bacterium]
MYNHCLAIRHNNLAGYPQIPPFDPEEPNLVYKAVRQCLLDLEMDVNHINTKDWSPFSDIIQPGNTVVIKPNLVLHTADKSLQEYTTTHPSVIRPIIDYVWKALKGEGKIIVGDACSAEADFDEIISRNGFKSMIDILRLREVNVELRDFRALKVTTANGIWTDDVKTNDVNPESQIVALGTESQLADKKYSKAIFHGAGYDIKSTNHHHNNKVHEYSVSKDILNADVVISVPKFKTHRKAGITCCLKNLVGINTDKNYLPHFAMGSINMGGDEMPEIKTGNVFLLRSYNWVRENIIAHTWKTLGKPAVAILGLLKKNHDKHSKTTGELSKDVDLAKWLHCKLSGQEIAAGAWPGNETICRMILDLNRIFLCCDRDGKLKEKTDRKFFYVVDAIGIGMGNGPTHPSPVNTGLVAAGWNGLSIDTQLLTLMNIDPEQFTLYSMARKKDWMKIDSQGDCLYNGKIVETTDRIPLKLIGPDNWESKFDPESRE